MLRDSADAHVRCCRPTVRRGVPCRLRDAEARVHVGRHDLGVSTPTSSTARSPTRASCRASGVGVRTDPAEAATTRRQLCRRARRRGASTASTRATVSTVRLRRRARRARLALLDTGVRTSHDDFEGAPSWWRRGATWRATHRVGGVRRHHRRTSPQQGERLRLLARHARGVDRGRQGGGVARARPSSPGRCWTARARRGGGHHRRHRVGRRRRRPAGDPAVIQMSIPPRTGDA